MAIRKVLPRQTVQNLIPPREDYVYFEAPRENPFRATSARFEIVNGVSAGSEESAIHHFGVVWALWVIFGWNPYGDPARCDRK